MKHNKLKDLYNEWQIYNNVYMNEFIYFNEFLGKEGFPIDFLAVGKNNLAIYKVLIDNISYLITDYGKTVEFQYYDDKLKKYVRIYNFLLG